MSLARWFFEVDNRLYDVFPPSENVKSASILTIPSYLCPLTLQDLQEVYDTGRQLHAFIPEMDQSGAIFSTFTEFVEPTFLKEHLEKNGILVRPNVPVFTFNSYTDVNKYRKLIDSFVEAGAHTDFITFLESKWDEQAQTIWDNS